MAQAKSNSDSPRVFTREKWLVQSGMAECGIASWSSCSCDITPSMRIAGLRHLIHYADIKTFNRLRCSDSVRSLLDPSLPLSDVDIYARGQQRRRGTMDQSGPWLFVGELY